MTEQRLRECFTRPPAFLKEELTSSVQDQKKDKANHGQADQIKSEDENDTTKNQQLAKEQ